MPDDTRPGYLNRWGVPNEADPMQPPLETPILPPVGQIRPPDRPSPPRDRPQPSLINRIPVVPPFV